MISATLSKHAKLHANGNQINDLVGPKGEVSNKFLNKKFSQKFQSQPKSKRQSNARRAMNTDK